MITGKLHSLPGMGARSPAGRGGEGRVSAALPILDDITTSPASRRLASARPALAPKCQLILARTLRAPPPRRWWTLHFRPDDSSASGLPHVFLSEDLVCQDDGFPGGGKARVRRDLQERFEDL